MCIIYILKFLYIKLYLVVWGVYINYFLNLGVREYNGRYVYKKCGCKYSAPSNNIYYIRFSVIQLCNYRSSIHFNKLK